MILEAFSEVLHDRYRRHGQASEDILRQWLFDYLGQPVDETCQISRVLHTEIELSPGLSGEPRFVGKSPSGQILLESLFQYCKSYENWQFSRWLHHLRASDFPLADC